MSLPKAPEKDIRYGMLQPDCEKKYKAWVVTLIEEAIKDPTKRIDIAYEIYEEVLQLGYDYGTDSAAEDRAWEF
jgi:hypothetical protein